MFDSIEGLSLNSGTASNQRVTKRASAEDWMRRLLIAFACLWLIVGIVLPLLDVVDKATHAEIVVKIEEPTEQEKLEDSFRGQINVGGHAVILTMEDDKKETLYINNKPVKTRKRKGRSQGEIPGVYAEIADERIEKIVCSVVQPDITGKDVLHVSPIIIERTKEQRWKVNDKLLSLGDNVMVIERFIGMVNFFDYFGIKGITQSRTFMALGSIFLAGILIVFFVFTLIRPTMPFNQNGMLTIGILILLAFQAISSIEFLTGHMEDSGLTQSVWNSLNVGLATTTISVTLAFLYAYGIHRTLMIGKTFCRIVAMIPLFAPTMLYGLSLVYMFGHKGVVTTGFFGYYPWLAWDIGLYGFTGIVIAEVVFTFPPAFMIMLVALSNTDARLYEASESLGAGKTRTFFKVTIPSIKFGLLSAIFVSFTLSFTDFGAPKIVGGQYNILAVDIYKHVIGQQNFGMGATVSIILLIPTVLAFIADRIIQRRAVALVTARAVPFAPKADRMRDILFSVIGMLIAAFILTMVFMAGVASLVKMWPYSFTHPDRYPQIWTLKHYLFDDVGGGGYRAFWNSIKMAGMTAVIGAFITFTSAYLIEKTKGARLLKQVAYFLSILPLALPGLVIGIAYIFFFNKPNLSIPFTGIEFSNPFNLLYGTMAILIVCNIIHFYTVSFLTATTALRQLDKEFESVSDSMAVPFYKTFMRVTVPVCFPAILEIAVYYFVSSMATVSAVIFLYTSDNPIAAVAVVNMDDAGDTAPAAAMCMLIVFANVILRSLAELVGHFFKQKTQAWRAR
ncbi:putative 2-aminoethylphosphonate ABC transporter permease subunit [Desulfococcaceae bacterium HSG9]|nr:putative 2-aminoethylphosphonate ABC transporter permease subunit [Desulfococcaceae bacterium HSG9]